MTWLFLMWSGEYVLMWDMASLLALALLVLGITLLHVLRAGHLIEGPKQVVHVPADALSKRIDELVEQNKVYCQSDLTLNDLAVEVGCSPKVLSLWFNQYLHIGFKRWLNEQRIKAAMELINQQPGTLVTTVGYEVGFNSSATFYRAFKQFSGVSPGAYKKSNLAKV